MRTKLFVAAVLAVVLAVPAMAYSGSLTAGGGGLSAPANSGAPNPWDSTSTVFSWDVTWNSSANLWYYQYSLVVPAKGISHILLEVSDEFATADIVSPAPSGIGDLNWYSATSHGNSNPSLPSLFRAIKIENAGSELSWAWSFYSPRAPVWGDFYAKDGVNNVSGQKTNVVLWNAGFGSPDSDPTDAPADGSVGYHILRPDTFNEGVPPNGETPELSTWLLLSLSGLAGAFVARRRRS